jgi:hypothetical protein
MGNGNRYDGAIGIRVDEAGGMFGSLKTAVTRLQDAAIKTTGNPLSEPEIDFAVPATFRRDTKRKGGIFVTLTFKGPASMAVLRVHMIRTADRVDQPTFKQQRFSDDITDIDEDEQTVLGAGGNFSREIAVRLEYGTQYDVYRLEAFNSTDTENANSIRNPTGQIVYNTPPYYQFTTPDAFGAPSAPNAGLIVYNELDPITPDIYDAHTGLKIYAPLTDGGAAQTWADSLTDWVQPTLTRDFGGSTGVVRIPFKRLLTSTELTQVDAASTPANRGYVVVEANNLVPGGTYIWVENLIHSNGQKKTATGSVSFIAAALATDLTALTNTAIVIKSTDPFDGKHVQPFWEFTQTNPATALKNYTFKYKKSTDTDFNVAVVRNNDFQADAYHKQLNAGTLSLTSGSKNVVGVGTEFLTRLQEGWKIKVGAQTLTIGTITDDTHMTVTANSAANASGQAYTVVIVLPLMDEFKVKPSTTYNVQLIVRARSGSPLTMNATFTTDADGNVVVDTAAPTLATNPDVGTTGPTVKERYSIVKYHCVLPSANINTLDDYQVILSSSSTAPAGDPTVGVAGVLAITYGQHGSFPLALTADLEADFYIIFRAHNGYNGGSYSVWSAATNQHGYSRPLEDGIGTAVPTLPLGLERSSTAPGSPAIANDSTHFSIDTSASSETDHYVGMVLEITSGAGAASNKVRQITAYDATNHRLTVTPAFGVTPADGLTFNIHRGVTSNSDTTQITIRGNNLGTQVDASHLVIDSGGSSTTDFYVGWSAYVPSLGASDQVRRVTAYNGTTKSCTLDSALSGTATNGIGFILFKGNIGYANVDRTGTITGIPARGWVDASGNIVIESILPTGEDAFSLNTIHVRNYKTTGKLINDIPQPFSSGPTVSWTGVNNNRSFTIQYRNDYRGTTGSPSDGNSAESYYARTPRPDDAASAYPGSYDPGATPPPPQPDPRAREFYPTERYTDY